MDISPPPFTALTFHNVAIPKYLADRKAVTEWIAEHGERWPGARIVRNTASGPRTIWRADAMTTGDPA